MWMRSRRRVPILLLPSARAAHGGEESENVMRTSFIPSTDRGLVSWSKNLVDQITSQAGHFGVPPLRLAALAQRQAEFAQAQAAVAQTETRSKAATSVKNQARATLLADVRGVVARVRADESLTNDQRITLGLSVPRPRRWPPP